MSLLVACFSQYPQVASTFYQLHLECNLRPFAAHSYYFANIYIFFFSWCVVSDSASQSPLGCLLYSGMIRCSSLIFCFSLLQPWNQPSLQEALVLSRGEWYIEAMIRVLRVLCVLIASEAWMLWCPLGVTAIAIIPAPYTGLILAFHFSHGHNNLL